MPTTEQLLKQSLQRIAALQLAGTNGYEDDLPKIIAHDLPTLEKWGKAFTDEERQKRNDAIFARWLAGETTVELANKARLSNSSLVELIQVLGNTKRNSSEISEQPPVYNVWNFSACDRRFGQKHPGQIPGQAVLNLLLWLTNPFDVVVDPMAGGGTTADVCKYLQRRYFF